ncbi:Ribonuclease [compost metagenome]
MLGDPRHQVLFVGYQATGTPGAVIQASEGAQGFVALDLDGEMYEIKARVATLGGYSAHADQNGLVAFVTGMQEWPERIVLVHGERRAKAALAEALRKSYEQIGKDVAIDIPS